jgi:RimJ/RimL family protein N-acetyltransferase
MQFCIDTYLAAFPKAKLWAIFNSQNAASIALAGKLGFQSVPEASEPGSHLRVMTRE